MLTTDFWNRLNGLQDDRCDLAGKVDPVKHGLVERVADWRWSSFHWYGRMVYYEQDWGGPVGKELEGISGGE